MKQIKKNNYNYHLNWYLKLPLSKDISLRYFFIFQNRPELEGQWVIKSHSDKTYGIIDENAVKLIVKLFDKSLDDMQEIIARRGKNKLYKKVILSNCEADLEKIKVIFESSNNIDNEKTLNESIFIKKNKKINEDIPLNVQPNTQTKNDNRILKRFKDFLELDKLLLLDFKQNKEKKNEKFKNNS